MDKYNELLSKMQNDYYDKHSKNLLLKNKQKAECAEFILSQIDINELLRNTFIILKDTNIIYMDYLLFKKYATDDNLTTIILYLIDVLNYMKQTYGSYCIYVNLDTLTISAMERYKRALSIFHTICLENDYDFSSFIQSCVILNVPNVVEMLKKIIHPFMTHQVKNIIEYRSKKDSQEILNRIISNIEK
jgi:hypothetical protein